MDLAYYVTENQDLIDDIKSRTPGQDDVDMYYGTLDYATARFNTIILKLSQDRIEEQIYSKDVEECFGTIQDFYKNVQRTTRKEKRVCGEIIYRYNMSA